jgi:hypothetical protein
MAGVIHLTTKAAEAKMRGKATMLRMIEDVRALVEAGEVTELVMAVADKHRVSSTFITVTESRLTAIALGQMASWHAREAEIEPLDGE